jgi:hypothetical protein
MNHFASWKADWKKGPPIPSSAEEAFRKFVREVMADPNPPPDMVAGSRIGMAYYLYYTEAGKVNASSLYQPEGSRW